MASFRCSCTNCILKEVSRLERKQSYKDAYLIFEESIKYKAKDLKSIQDAFEKFKTKMRSVGVNVQLDGTEKKKVRSVAHSKCERHDTAVAIFDEEYDPNKKPMYPKHLVYKDGRDIQLEEIYAARYSEKRKATKVMNSTKTIIVAASVDNEVKTEVNRLPLRELKVSENDLKPPAPSSIPILIRHLSNEKPETKVAKEKSNLPPAINNQTVTLDSRPVDKRTECFVAKDLIPVVDNEEQITRPQAKEESATLDVEQKVRSPVAKEYKASTTWIKSTASYNKENYPFEIRDNSEEEEDDSELNTHAFAHLPTSTPFQSNKKNNKTQPNSANKCESFVAEDRPVPTAVAEYAVPLEPIPSLAGSSVRHLSMIQELSKERYSQERDRTNVDVTFTVQQQKDGNGYRNASNPFDRGLVDGLLQDVVKFPCAHHLEGYAELKTDMPSVKPQAPIKLDSERFHVSTEIGKGAYARILKIQHESTADNKIYALKVQKPACLWEWYINKEIIRRLSDTRMRQYFMEYSKMYVYKNGSLMLSDWAPYGTILNLVNNFKSTNNQSRFPMSVSTFLSIQAISAIQYLHTCQIIHGDVKPDNFIITTDLSSTELRLKLIDYGRSIDMSLLSPGQTFTYAVATDEFVCNEMKENKPWTYQTDLFGLAGTMYILLLREYMKTEKRDSRWTLKRPLPRYLLPGIWNPIFDSLLNIPSCSELPDLSVLIASLQEFYSTIDKYQINQGFSTVFNAINNK